MYKVEIVMRPEKLSELQEALAERHFHGMTVSEVQGCGLQKGHMQSNDGPINVMLLPKIKVEIVVPSDSVRDILDTVNETARTGKVGDGKIFVSELVNVYRIRTGERAQSAL